MDQDSGHTYRIGEIIRSTERKMGRPKRIILQEFKNVSAADLAVMRKHHETCLKPSQFTELDGKTVARGSQVTPADDQAELVTPQSAEQEGASFLHNLIWDVHAKSSEASAEVREQIKAFNAHMLTSAQAAEAKALEHLEQVKARCMESAKQYDQMLNELLKLKIEMLRAPAQSTQTASIDLEGLGKLIAAGFETLAEVRKKG